MDWNYLRTFQAVADTGSLSAAAERLSISHATAFRHIKAFETELGTRLFDKVQGKYGLTDAGSEILDLARSVAVAMEDIDRRISGTDIQLKGRIRLTAPASFSWHFLPGYLAAFRQAYPEITVELLSSNEELNMSNRAAEIALRVTHTPPEHLIGRRVADIPWGFYASAAYLSERGTPSGLGALGEHDLIGAAGAQARREGFAQIDRMFRARVVVRCDDLMAMAACARQGQGLALLPADVARDGLLHALAHPDLPDNQLWILTHPDLRKVERVRRMMNFLGESFSKEQGLSSR
ncbi:LysR family transcriptional regulator [Roseibium sediminicola]|uniref:LysR family transcriptional regulator n=1 Tax=Roseibium sediminicola TaxID=2933272 RepID=A0ABT0GQX3_9HYPH|nr:LysR family transcriptional regulator [Roseibium sp. CAU 1639]MCK7611610.1 LysR family transcriptional regulator [Roseibium sp. CAU 1639]